VREDPRACGVNPDGQVVGDELLDVFGKRGGAVAVGDRLVVGDHDEQLQPLLLETDAVLERPEQVAEMQPAGRAIAGQHTWREHPAARICGRFKLSHGWAFRERGPPEHGSSASKRTAQERPENRDQRGRVKSGRHQQRRCMSDDIARAYGSKTAKC
jgi:hypothetical protein